MTEYHDTHGSMAADMVGQQRCGFCRKAMLNKLYHCKECSERCKRRCKHSGTPNCRRCSRRRTKTSEDHWTKVLQASEVNSNFVIRPCALTLGSHIVEVGDVCRCNRGGKTAKDSGVFSSLYDRFCQWLMSKRKSSPTSGMRPTDQKTRNEPKSPTWGIDLGYASFDEVVLNSPIESTSDFFHSRVHTMSSSDSCSCCSYSTTSSLSSATFGVSPTDDRITDIVDNYSPVKKPESPWKNEEEEVDLQPDKFYSLQLSRHAMINERARERRHTSLTATLSCPPKPVSRGLTTSRESKTDMATLCATWPLIGYHSDEYDTDCEGSGSVFEDEIRDELFSLSRPPSTNLRDNLGDCTIPFSDLEFGQCIRVGRRQQIHRGRWHGDVNIHTFREQTNEEAKNFLTEVTTLSMIRHDNITLFMGACIERPTLAVVTGITRGPSLYQNLHVRAVKMVMHTKVQIASQIAQAMGYLHAKGVILRRLNTKNVILEPKVKISIMDLGMTEQKCDRMDRGCISRGHLTYIAPEVLSTVRVEPPRLHTEAAFTRETDVFAFGTVLYELLSGQFPYQGLPPETVIWQVCGGKRQSLTHINCLTFLKELIQDCWAHDSLYRPEFREVTKDLMNAALHKRHSSSEPEGINRSGFTRRNLFS